MNSRITKLERALIRNAIRRVFSRSDLRRKVMDAAEIKHYDKDRPRVTRWSLCNICKKPGAKYESHCDHILPVVPTNISADEIDFNQLVDNIFCDPSNLQSVCLNCHKDKTKKESAVRTKTRRSKKK